LAALFFADQVQRGLREDASAGLGQHDWSWKAQRR
jgi:hypothetical protein